MTLNPRYVGQVLNIGVPLKYWDEEIVAFMSAWHFIDVRRTLDCSAPDETTRAPAESRESFDRGRTWLISMGDGLAVAETRFAVRTQAL